MTVNKSFLSVCLFLYLCCCPSSSSSSSSSRRSWNHKLANKQALFAIFRMTKIYLCQIIQVIFVINFLASRIERSGKKFVNENIKKERQETTKKNLSDLMSNNINDITKRRQIFTGIFLRNFSRTICKLFFVCAIK